MSRVLQPGITTRRAGFVLLAFIVMFLVALAPRMAARDNYVTLDEDNWMKRTAGFTFALWSGELRRTYQNGHPGVTTTWLGMLGMGPEQALQFATKIRGQGPIGRVPGFTEALPDARAAMAVATAALTAGIGLLTWRLWGPGPGIAAGLLLALDPFSVALGQLLHLDGLLSGFMAVSALAGIVFWWDRGSRGYLVLAGVAAGLALLSKTPAIFLAPYAAFLALVALLTRRSSPTGAAVSLAIFGGLMAATYVALWPALWLAPVEMIGRVLDFLRETGGQPHEGGSFFLGQRVADPGPAFYPLALLYRLGLGVLLGLAILLVVSRRAPRPALIGLTLAFVLGFGLMMTLGPKKFDRYVLPIVPMLAVLAGLGLWTLGRWAVEAWDKTTPAIASGALGLALLLQGWGLLSVYPYYLSYYNPLLGGAPVAAQRVMVGYGEGLDQVADWLNARPAADQISVGAHSFDILQAQIDGKGESLRDRVPGGADYIVLYRFQIQVGQSPRVIEEYLGQREPELTVRINGLDYAYVYKGPHLLAGAPS